jgi:hypothetical protein
VLGTPEDAIAIGRGAPDIVSAKVTVALETASAVVAMEKDPV